MKHRSLVRRSVGDRRIRVDVYWGDRTDDRRALTWLGIGPARHGGPGVIDGPIVGVSFYGSHRWYALTWRS